MGQPRVGQRPRNAEATRQLILDSARHKFGADGFRRATVKGIADAAGVSPNLITRYFGGKNGLFLAASELRIAADEPFSGDLNGLGERLARSIVERWSGHDGDDPLLLLLRASGEHAEAAEVLATFLDESSIRPIERYLRLEGVDARDARDRAGAIDVFIVGVSARRRILRDDLGAWDELERWLSVTIQRLATGN